MTKPGLPVELRLEGRRVLVIGDGDEAESRLPPLIAAGALLTRAAAWTPADLHGVTLVLLTGRDQTTEAARLHAACRDAGALLWAHDAPAHCDVTMTALIEAGPVRLSISSGARSSALTRAVRDALRPLFDAEFIRWAEAAVRDRRRKLTLRVRGRLEPDGDE